MSHDSKTATSAAPTTPNTRNATPNSRKASTSAPTNPGSAGGAATVTKPAMPKHSTATNPPTNSGSLGESVYTPPRGATKGKTVSAGPARAQTTLPAVAVAIVVLTAVTGLGLFVADTAITGADRDPDERRVAAAIAAQLVAADGPLADRANVLNDSELDAFDDATLRDVSEATTQYAVAVRLNGTTIGATGEPTEGPTIRRLVLVEERNEETLVPEGTTATLPRRVSSATVTLTPPNGTTIRTVRANEQVVLHNESGLQGTFDLRLATYETTDLRLQAVGDLPDGAVEISYDAPRTTKATLAVTVDG